MALAMILPVLENMHSNYATPSVTCVSPQARGSIKPWCSSPTQPVAHTLGNPMQEPTADQAQRLARQAHRAHREADRKAHETRSIGR